MIDFLTHAISWLNDTVFMKVPFFGSEIPWVVLWLAIPMVIFTVWFGFINLRAMPVAFRVLRGRYDDPKAPGHISQFAALTTALSGTVGLGNIAGVAVAIASGGPGAAFWMFIIGFFAMTLKCAEVTLGLKYREVDADGTVRGGPMYSLKNGLRAKGMAKLGLVLGGIYAVLLFVGAIPMVQVNQSLSALVSTSGIESSFNNKLIFGLVMAFFVGLVVIGGVKRLGRVTSILVPFMALIYLIGILIIIAVNFAEVPNAIALIVSDAFSGDAVAGGMVGAFIVGMQRAVYSSEAGVGSAVIAHAQARTHEPASEGLVALLEPFIDTVVVCSLGAIAIVLAGTWQVPEGDISITVAAFAQISSWFPWLLTLAVLLFAHSTLCAWGFYGLQGFEYMFGAGRWRSLGYKIAYILVLPVAALLDKSSVFDLIDSAFFLMAIPNVIALYVFAPELRRDLLDYMARSKRGEIPLSPSNSRIPQIQKDTGL